MTPKEKAKELIDKYLNASFNCNDCTIPFCDIACTKLYTKEAAECALIALDEMLNNELLTDLLQLPDDSPHKYKAIYQKMWLTDVKNELLKQQNNG